MSIFEMKSPVASNRNAFLVVYDIESNVTEQNQKEAATLGKFDFWSIPHEIRVVSPLE